MIRKEIMSFSSRFNTKDKKLLSTVFSPKNMTNTKAQIRAFQSKSSPVYKTKSETSLVSDFRNLNLREKPKPPSTRPVRRGFCTGNSGRINIKSLQDIAKIFSENQVKNVVVVAGAGISTPSGIPDFRTPGTGLYDNLQQYQIPYPEAIFDIDYFHRNPKPFFTLAKELFPSLGNYRPNYIHYFVRMLHEKGMLLRMYTQNIDGLERLAGIPPSKLVEAHGTFATATCVFCGHKCDGDDIKDRILDDKLPKCKKTSCPGMVKPDIVFFGEDLPRKFYYHLKDMLQADIILIMGTSLEVQPFAGIIDSVRWQVPRILFNRDVVGPFRHQRRSKDVVAEGDILETMQKFVDMIGWKEEIKELIIKSEGDYNIGKVCLSETSAIEKKKSETKTVIKDPFVNAIWRQNAKYNLQDYCSSSSTVSETTSESSSSDSSGPRNFRRTNVRLYNSAKNSAIGGKQPLKKGSTQNYSTKTNSGRLRKPNSAKIPDKLANTDKTTKHVPVIISKSYNTSKTATPTKLSRPATPTKPPRTYTPSKPPRTYTPTKPPRTYTPTKPSRTATQTNPPQAATPTKPPLKDTPTKPSTITTPIATATKPPLKDTPTKPSTTTTPTATATKPPLKDTPTKPPQAATATKPPQSPYKLPISNVGPPLVTKDSSNRIGSFRTRTTPVVKTDIKEAGSRNFRNALTSIHVYKAIHQRANSVDLPQLRLREKLKRNVVDSSSNESTSDLSSGS